ncbi:MAG: hypothetical protein AB4206_03760 [Xenococcaceae cyanobacterium]
MKNDTDDLSPVKLDNFRHQIFIEQELEPLYNVFTANNYGEKPKQADEH